MATDGRREIISAEYMEGTEEHSLEGGSSRTHHKGLGGWAALLKGTGGWRTTQWPGDGSPMSACVGCFEAWGQTPAGVAERNGQHRTWKA